MSKELGKHQFYFGREGVVVDTTFFDNGDGDIFTRQILTLASDCNRASFEIVADCMTPVLLRQLADQLEAKEGEFHQMTIGGEDFTVDMRKVPFMRDVSPERWIATIASFIETHWPHAIFNWESPEDAFVFKDKAAEASWEQHGSIPENEDDMVQIILRDGQFTFVVGDIGRAMGKILRDHFKETL